MYRKIRRAHIIMAISFFLLGSAIVYLYNLNWIRKVRSATDELVFTFRDTYLLQQELTKNYSQSYDTLAQCLLIEKNNCDLEALEKNAAQLKSERDNLKQQLYKADAKTKIILQKFPH